MMEYLTVPANGTAYAHSPAATARVLIEPGCDSGTCKEGSDHAMFKGATMRHLGYLRRTAGLPEAQRVGYQRFAEVNAESCW